MAARGQSLDLTLIENPQTGRLIRAGGPTHRKLIRDGLMGSTSAAEGTRSENKKHQELEPPPAGHHWEVSKKGKTVLKKNPESRQGALEKAMRAAAMTNLKALGVEITDENIDAMVERMNAIALESATGVAPRTHKVKLAPQPDGDTDEDSADSDSEESDDDAGAPPARAPRAVPRARASNGRFALRA